MKKIELQEEGMFQKLLEQNLCPKCALPLQDLLIEEKKIVQKCAVCKLTVI
jgi:rubrerythrin